MKLATGEANPSNPSRPCLDPPQELDSGAAFSPSTKWGRCCAEKRLSQGQQRWSLSSHLSSAASDSPRLWDGRPAHGPIDRYGLGPLASKEGSPHSAVSHLRTHSHMAHLLQAYLCSLYHRQATRSISAMARLHQRPITVTNVPPPCLPTLLWA